MYRVKLKQDPCDICSNEPFPFQAEVGSGPAPAPAAPAAPAAVK